MTARTHNQSDQLRTTTISDWTTFASSKNSTRSHKPYSTTKTTIFQTSHRNLIIHPLLPSLSSWLPSITRLRESSSRSVSLSIARRLHWDAWVSQIKTCMRLKPSGSQARLSSRASSMSKRYRMTTHPSLREEAAASSIWRAQDMTRDLVSLMSSAAILALSMRQGKMIGFSYSASQMRHRSRLKSYRLIRINTRILMVSIRTQMALIKTLRVLMMTLIAINKLRASI